MKSERGSWSYSQPEGAAQEIDAVNLDLENGVEMTVLVGAGPRIINLRRAGSERNLLFEDDQARGLYDWQIFGGIRVWPTKGADVDETKECYWDDGSPCKFGMDDGSDFTVMSAPMEPYDTRRGFVVQPCESVNGFPSFWLTSVIQNVGKFDWQGGVWTLACTEPKNAGGEVEASYEIPLHSDGKDDWEEWRIGGPVRWGANQTSSPGDAQFIQTDYSLRGRPDGRESKRIWRTHRGTIAMHTPQCFFITVTRVRPGMVYPKGMCGAIYIGNGNFMVEKELEGPVHAVNPGQAAVLDQILILTDPDHAKVDKEAERCQRITDLADTALADNSWGMETLVEDTEGLLAALPYEEEEEGPSEGD